MSKTEPAETSLASVAAFFVLTYALSVPFWILSAATGVEILPRLPIGAFMAVCPIAAAAILIFRANGSAGVVRLLKRSFDWNRMRSALWCVPAVLIMPGVMLVSFFVQREMDVDIPVPNISLVSALVLTGLFFFGAIAEEMGWSGYATGPMQARWGTVSAGVALGVVWAAFHYVALIEVHRSVEWIAWWSLGTIAARVIIVRLYIAAGNSVFLASLFHMMVNVTWQLYPVHGSFFDPRVTSSIMVLVAVIAVALPIRKASLRPA
jgi:membrane protease YdiL (CAAX protease family)